MEQTPSDKLPEGKTCSDCAHWKRCSALIDDLEGTETHCDWAPSRFKAETSIEGGATAEMIVARDALRKIEQLQIQRAVDFK